MKKFLMLLSGALMSVSVAAKADDSVIYVSHASDLHDVQTRMHVNADTGRAWVSLVANRTFDEVPYERQILVNGLRFDPASQQVLLSSNGGDIVCGTTRERGVGPFKSLSVVPNGNCQIEANIVTRPRDTGVAVREQRVMEVRLNAPSS